MTLLRFFLTVFGFRMRIELLGLPEPMSPCTDSDRLRGLARHSASSMSLLSQLLLRSLVTHRITFLVFRPLCLYLQLTITSCSSRGAAVSLHLFLRTGPQDTAGSRVTDVHQIARPKNLSFQIFLFQKLNK